MNKRKMKLDVTMDIDGVIADFEDFYCHRFGEENRHLVNLVKRHPHKAKEIEAFIDDRSTYMMLLPEAVGIDICRWLMERVTAYGEHTNRANVTLLTSRPNKTYDVTKKWLKMENVPYHQLEFTDNKVMWMKEHQPDIIVDDLIEICQGALWTVPDLTAVLVAHKWNEDTPFIPRIRTLKEFQRIYKEVALAKLFEDSGGIGVA